MSAFARRQIVSVAYLNKCARTYAHGNEPREFKDVPQPGGLPLVGTTLSLLSAGGPAQLHKYIDRRHKELGPIFKDNVGPVTCVFLADPEGMRSVFAQEGKYPLHIKPEAWLLYNEINNYSRGLFFMDGEEWLRFRKIMNNLLMKGDLTWIKKACHVATDLFLSRIQQNVHSEFPNLEQELYKWSVDNIVSVLVGAKTYREESFKLEPLTARLASTIHKVFESTVKFQLISAKMAAKLSLPRWKNFCKTVDEALGAANETVDYIVEKLPENQGLVRKMMLENMERKDIKKIVADLILGAGDTSSYTMEWILYLVGKNPSEQSKLRSQLKVDPATPFLRNIVRESLRLYPVAAFLTRFLTKSSIINGFSVPENTLVVMSIYTSGRDEKFFKNPDEFCPDRWSRNNDTQANMQQGSLPFAMGKRSCIGRKIAETQLQVTLAEIVKKYNIQVCNDKDIECVLQMVTKPSEPVRIKFTEVTS